MGKKKVETETEAGRLNNEILRLSNKLHKIKHAEADAQNMPLLGKCFKRIDRYKKVSWPVYQRVTFVDGEWLTIFSLYVRTNGMPDFRENEMCSVGELGKPCSLREMRAAWRREIKRSVDKGNKALE